MRYLRVVTPSIAPKPSLKYMSLKYMLRCKIMPGTPEDAQALVNRRLTLQYVGGRQKH